MNHAHKPGTVSLLRQVIGAGLVLFVAWLLVVLLWTA